MNVYFFYELTALEMTKISGRTLKLISENHYGWIIYYITTNELAKCAETLPDNSVPVLTLCSSMRKISFGAVKYRLNLTAKISSPSLPFLAA